MKKKMSYHVEDLPRHEAPNPFKYDEDALAQKAHWLRKLAQMYPNVNALWREWVYDVCVNTPPEELEAMKARIATSPGCHGKGGVLWTPS